MNIDEEVPDGRHSAITAGGPKGTNHLSGRTRTRFYLIMHNGVSSSVPPLTKIARALQVLYFMLVITRGDPNLCNNEE